MRDDTAFFLSSHGVWVLGHLVEGVFTLAILDTLGYWVYIHMIPLRYYISCDLVFNFLF